MRKITILLFTALLFSSLVINAQSLSGDVNFESNENGMLYLIDVFGQGDTLVKCSITNHEGKLKGTYPLNKLKNVALVSYLLVEKDGKNRSGMFFIEKDKHITYKIFAGEQPPQVTGSENSVVMNTFYNDFQQYFLKIQSASATPNNESEINEAKVALSEFMYNFIKKNTENDLTEFCLAFLGQSLTYGILTNDRLNDYQVISKSHEKNFKVAQMVSYAIESKLIVGIGKQAPDFSLQTNKNKTIKLQDLKSKYILLDFWALWCAPCIKNIPKINQLKDSYRSDKLQIIGVSVDKDIEQWKKTIAKHKPKYTNIIDNSNSETGMVASRYDISKYPTYILLDENKKIVIISSSLEEIEKYLKNK